MGLIRRLVQTGVVASIAAAPVQSDTVWWKNDAGNVTEHRIGAVATCSLWLNSESGNVWFTWSRDKPATVSLLTLSPFVTDMNHASAVLSIDQQPLGSARPTQIIGNTITFSLETYQNRLLIERLRTGKFLMIRANESNFSMALMNDQMPKLIEQTELCRHKTR